MRLADQNAKVVLWQGGRKQRLTVPPMSRQKTATICIFGWVWRGLTITEHQLARRTRFVRTGAPSVPCQGVVASARDAANAPHATDNRIIPVCPCST